MTAPPVKQAAQAHGTPVFQPKTLRDGGEDQALGFIRDAVALYRGRFLPCEPDKAWAFTYREHLRGRFGRLVLCVRGGSRV